MVKKSHSFNLTSRNTTRFKFFNGFFNSQFDNDGTQFEKYINAFRSNPLVYMIIKKISAKESTLPRMYVDANGKIVEDPVIKPIMVNPNKEQLEIDFRENIDEELLTTGNAFIRTIGVPLNPVAEMTVLETENVDIKINSINEVVGYVYNKNGKKIPIKAEEILHIKTTNITNTEDEAAFYGLAPLEAAFNLVISSNEIFEAEAVIFKNRGIAGMLTNDTDVPMLSNERERVQEDLDKDMGGADNFNKVLITNNSLKYIQMGMSPTDLKLLEGIVSKLRLLCAVYGLNSVLFNDPANSKFDNIAEAQRGAMLDAYIPLGKKIDRSLSKFLSAKFQVDERILIDEKKIDVLKVMNTDLSEQIIKQFEAGIITQDQALDALGWEEEE